MHHPTNSIETLASAIYAACLRDLPEITYQDRDWTAYRTYMNGLSAEEKRALRQRESEEGVLLGPMIEKTRRPTPHDVEVVLFPQSWGSTALGYGGIGGQAMTRAYTAIVTCKHSGSAAVYFGDGGRLAYLVPAAREANAFREDIAQQIVTGRRNAVERYGAIAP